MYKGLFNSWGRGGGRDKGWCDR